MAKVQTAPVQVRWMIRRDLPEVLEIEQASFSAPWTEKDCCRILQRRDCIGNVAERGEHVVGYLVHQLYRDKFHVLNLAVHRHWRRCGVATQLLARLLGRLSSRRRTYVTADVRESNLGAQLFFQALGFQAAHILRSPYEDTDEDAYRMRFDWEG